MLETIGYIADLSTKQIALYAKDAQRSFDHGAEQTGRAETEKKSPMVDMTLLRWHIVLAAIMRKGNIKETT